MKEIYVKDIMTPRDKVITISAFAGVRELLQVMKKENVKSVVVDRRDEHDAYGIVTCTNILNAIFEQDGDMDLLNVYDVATKPIIQIMAELHIKYAAKMMVQQKVNRLIVTFGGEMVGIIAMNDIAQVLMDMAHEDE